MDEYSKLLSLVDSEVVAEGADLPKIQLHKWLVLGQTEYMCRYGTLSDGHEKITDAQRYAQAIKELYYICSNIANQKASAMEAKAELLDAQEALSQAVTDSQKLRAEARLLKAQNSLTTCLVTVEDQMRSVKAYVQVKEELREKVEAQYPGGLEEAERDNWIAVAKYRSIKEKTPGSQREQMYNIPLDPETKARLGIAMDRPDMVAPLMVARESDIAKLPKQSVEEYLQITGSN